MKVLIVDDSRAARMKLRSALVEAGFDRVEVEEAASGEAALAKLQHTTPDLMLVDVNMPGMDGFDLLGELAKERLSVDVGFVTGVCSPEVHRKAISAGAMFVLEKPYTVESLRNTVGPHLSAQTVAVERWLDAGVSAMHSIGDKLLGVAPNQFVVVKRRVGDEAEISEGIHGPHVTVASSRVELLLALNASPENHIEIARAMMTTAGMDPSEELGPDEVADCLTEVLNLWAGAFRRSTGWLDRSLKLGVPAFTIENLAVPGTMSAGVADVRLGWIAVQLVVAGRSLVSE